MKTWFGGLGATLALVHLALGLTLTLGGRAETVVIGCIGDYGAAAVNAAGYSNELAVANLVKSWDPEFIITTGDNNYPDGEAANIDFNIGQFYHEFIYPYTGAFGEGATSNRFFPCIGNHDWSFGVAYLQPYLDYFTLPGNERYYSHRHGPIELFALSSDEQEPDGATNGSIQALWLSNALAVSTAPWRVVYFHRSPYSSGALHGTYSYDPARNMFWPFREWGANLVLTAHDHLYERIVTNGLTYIVNGLGGGRIDAFRYPLVPGSQAHYNASHGALRLDVTETNLLCRFYNISNQLIDACLLEIAPPQLRAVLVGGAFVLEVSGTPDRSYLIEATSDFASWMAVATNRLENGLAWVTNDCAAPWRFYRARFWR